MQCQQLPIAEVAGEGPDEWYNWANGDKEKGQESV